MSGFPVVIRAELRAQVVVDAALAQMPETASANGAGPVTVHLDLLAAAVSLAALIWSDAAVLALASGPAEECGAVERLRRRLRPESRHFLDVLEAHGFVRLVAE